MKPRKINIKDGEIVEIYVNCEPVVVCLRSDVKGSVFIEHNTTDTHSVDWSDYRAAREIESARDVD